MNAWMGHGVNAQQWWLVEIFYYYFHSSQASLSTKVSQSGVWRFIYLLIISKSVCLSGWRIWSIPQTLKRTGGPKTFKNTCVLKKNKNQKKKKTALCRNVKGKAGTAPGTQTGSAGEADCPHSLGLKDSPHMAPPPSKLAFQPEDPWNPLQLCRERKRPCCSSSMGDVLQAAGPLSPAFMSSSLSCASGLGVELGGLLPPLRAPLQLLGTDSHSLPWSLGPWAEHSPFFFLHH